MANAAFPYPTLLPDNEPSFRILRYLGREIGTQLHSFELTVFPLSSLYPQYQALSYTWGSPFPADHAITAAEDWDADLHVVCCNAQRFKIRKNLLDALDQVVGYFKDGDEDGKARYLWIDAICINQRDDKERFEQVKLMADIYSKCNEAVIWLGRADPAAESFMKLNAALSTRIQSAVAEIGWTTFLAYQTGDEELHARLGVGAEELGVMIDIDSYVEFYRRTWWSRTWTLQEVALAPKSRLMCGNQVMKLEGMSCLDYWLLFSTVVRDGTNANDRGLLRHSRRILNSIRSMQDDCRDPGTRIGKSKWLRWIAGVTDESASLSQGMMLSRYLDDTRESEATDLRDKIYGLFGVLKHTTGNLSKEFVSGGYEYGVYEIYLKIASAIIMQTPSLILLSLVRHDAGPDTRLASWVPDFSKKQKFSIGTFGFAAFEDRDTQLPYSTLEVTGRVPASRRIMNGKLYLRGAKVGTILSKLEFFAGSTAEFILHLLKFAEHAATKYHEKQPLLEAVWRCTIADMTPYNSPAPKSMGQHFCNYLKDRMVRKMTSGQRNETLQLLEVLQRASNSTMDEDLMLTIREDCSNMLKWVSVADADSGTPVKEVLIAAEKLEAVKRSGLQYEKQTRLYSYKMMLTSAGLLGLCPHGAEVADEVWVLENGRVPFIVRRTKIKNEFLLVGECYLGTIMHGERNKLWSKLYEEICLI